MTKTNPTDEKILKFWHQGCTIPKIASKIGRPGDFARVVAALERAKLLEPNTPVGREVSRYERN